MAVTPINLWLESIEPGKPLSFLDHHIQCGNSLLGATPSLLANGIPDEAFTPIEGDEKTACSQLKKENKRERQDYASGQGYLFEPPIMRGNIAAEFAKLTADSEDTAQDVASKEERYARLVRSVDYETARLWADTWCSVFVWKKDKSDLGRLCPAERKFRDIERNPHNVLPAVRSEIKRLREQYQFLHWHLAFPDVFGMRQDDESQSTQRTGWSGGFDVVLGNPPWERIKLQEKEWFAERRPDIAAASNAAKRRRMIQSLAEDDPALHSAFLDAQRQAEGESYLTRNTGRYPLCGRGDVNTYALFAELNLNLLNQGGAVGCIVPCGIATDDTTKHFFRYVCDSQQLVAVWGFINEQMLFPGVLHNVKFCLLLMNGAARKAARTDFVFNCHNMDHFGDDRRHFTLTAREIAILNPNSGTCPVFFWRRSAEITLQIYSRIPILEREGTQNGWDIKFFTMFHMANDSGVFSTHPFTGALPLYEAKMIHQYNHRFASHEHLDAGQRSHMLPESQSAVLVDPQYTPTPCYYVPADEVDLRLQNRFPTDWLLGYREITSVGLWRTTIYSALPRAGVNHKIPLVSFGPDSRDVILGYMSCMNSLPLDFFARQKLGGSSFSFFVKKQLPVLPPEAFRSPCPWAPVQSLLQWIRPRLLELTYTAFDLEPFAVQCGWTGPPFRWDDVRRFLLRSELDAAYFRLYGLEREHAEYIADTFPIMKQRDEEQHGEYRTKRVILEIYDAMAESIRTGQPYQTLLDPPPGPPAVGLPDWQPGQPRPANWPSHIHPPRYASADNTAQGSIPQDQPRTE
jgi:hypothetical protein